MKLNVIVHQGSVLPVSLDDNATIKDVVAAVYAESALVPVKVIHNGRILVPALTLRFQNVSDGDTVVLYEPPGVSVVKIPYIEATSFAKKLYSVLLEAHRISDREMMWLESVSDQWIVDELDEEEAPADVFPTVLEKPPETIPEAPLPVLVDTKEEGSEPQCAVLKPYFSSIEGAGDFFMKQIEDEWSW